MNWNEEEIRKAGKDGEINYIDVEHLISVLKESQPPSPQSAEGVDSAKHKNEILEKVMNETGAILFNSAREAAKRAMIEYSSILLKEKDREIERLKKLAIETFENYSGYDLNQLKDAIIEFKISNNL